MTKSKIFPVYLYDNLKSTLFISPVIHPTLDLSQLNSKPLFNPIKLLNSSKQFSL